MFQTTLYQQTMRQKLSDLESKLDTLEQKTLYSYSEKRKSILEHILQIRKERQHLLGSVDRLAKNDRNDLQEINRSWQAIKNHYNQMTLMLEGTKVLREP